MARVEVIRSKVAGVSFKNDDGSDRQQIIRKYCQAGVSLRPVREPNNPHSPDGTAVGLWVPTETRHWQVGHVREGLSEDVSDHLVRGGSVSVRILEVTGGSREKPSLGLNIQIELIPPQVNRSPGRPVASRPVATRQPVEPGWSVAERLDALGTYTWRGLCSACRAVPVGYRALPDWAQPIVWGLGASTALVVFALLLRLLRQ